MKSSISDNLIYQKLTDSHWFTGTGCIILTTFRKARMTRYMFFFFYKHTKIQKQAQRCLGRELNEAEKMLEGCLDPKLNFGEIPNIRKIPVKNSQK